MFRTATALVAAAMLTSAAVAADAPSRTITVRGGQGSVITVAVPATAPARTQPYQLTGSHRDVKTVTIRTGQGGLVQVPAN